MSSSPPSRPLNRNSAAPLYSQLAEDLQRQIDAAVWRPRDPIPSEAALGQRYWVCRTVVRQALDELETAGVIYRIKGKCGFVSEHKLMAFLMQDVGGFAANMADQGFAVESRVLAQGFVAAPARVAEALRIPEGSALFGLERLRSVAGEPLFLGSTWVPGDLGRCIEAQDFATQSLNTVLARCAGKAPVTGTRVIESVVAGRHEADLLRVRVGAPLFRLFAVTYAQDGAAMECSQVWLRGDRLAFRVELAPRIAPETPGGAVAGET